jgi:hypothetical protein
MRRTAVLLVLVLAFSSVGAGLLATAGGANGFIGTLTVSPAPAIPGQIVTISGANCSGRNGDGLGSQVVVGVSVVGSVAFVPPVAFEATPAEDGSWSAQITIPAHTLPGDYAVTASCVDSVTEVGSQAIGPYDPGSIVSVVAAPVAAPVAAEAPAAVVAAPRTTG